MHIPHKKLSNGFSMPVYGIGTWTMGGRMQRDLENDDTADIKAIQTAIDAGVTHIDTAEIYAQGHSEILTGKAIQQYEREKLFLVSKVYSHHMSYDALIQACKDSLERLGTPYLDLYLFHRYPKTTLKASIKAMDTLLEEGLIKNIGVSNFTLAHMQEAQSYTKHKIVATQVHFNLQYREPEKAGVLNYCQENDIMLIAWRPLQKGIILKENEILTKLCQKYKKTPAQIALNWLISQKNVVTLSKTTKIDHLKENIEAIGWTMES
ncbi:MAG: aldo/keto reductase, partial [Candidatus Levybacteria bacterium]|nr:aldo/keto reductase [Candidatus Levybacteria bacterium]